MLHRSKDFVRLFREKVLKPLGMTRSFVMLGSRTTDPNVAKGYVVKDGKVSDADEYPLSADRAD